MNVLDFTIKNDTIKSDYIVNSLSLIRNKAIKKRLIYECMNLNVHDHYNMQIFYKEANACIHVIETVDNRKIHYEFEILPDYPFVCPKIVYQGRPYKEYLRMKSEIEFKLITSVSNKNCFCCSSYCCNGKWSPCITIKKLIEEIKTVAKTKRDIINKWLSDKIKKKYLIEDIDLDSWLF